MRASKTAGMGLVALLRVASCSDEDLVPPMEPTAGISGTVMVASGSTADPIHARAAAYSSVAEFDAGLWTRQTPVARRVDAWVFDLELDPGSYYVDVWDDSDADGQIGVGDVYGYYAPVSGGAPAPVHVDAGRMTGVAVEVRAVVAGTLVAGTRAVRRQRRRRASSSARRGRGRAGRMFGNRHLVNSFTTRFRPSCEFFHNVARVRV